MRFMLYAGLLLAQLPAFATVEISKQEIHNLYQTIEANYGPLLMKEESVGLNWEKTKAMITAKLEAATTQSEYRDCASVLLGLLQDSHVGISFPSSYRATLPFQIKNVQGKDIINFAETDFWKQFKIENPLKVGDEILTIDGKTPDQLRKELMAYHSGGNEKTDLAYLSLALTNRAESRGMPSSLLPINNQVSTIIFKRDAQVMAIQIPWVTTGVKNIDREIKVVDDSTYVSKLPVDHAPTKEEAAKIQAAIDQVLAEANIPSITVDKRKRLTRIMEVAETTNKLFETKLPEAKMVQRPEIEGVGVQTKLGDKKPFLKLPKNFKKIEPPFLFKNVLNAGQFTAGTFMRNGRRVGYLRIPSYSPNNLMLALYSTRYYIGKLQQESDVLIIDQFNNPGGYVAFSDWIIESLVGKLDLSKHMKFAVRPREGFVTQYAAMIKELTELMYHPGQSKETIIKYKFYIRALEAELAKVYKSYINGDFITEPISLALTSVITRELIQDELNIILRGYLGLASLASGVQLGMTQEYTKPVYFLINELDFSGGDATPANLQDYERVTLVGQNTAGAGGTVEEFHSEVFTPFDYRLTTSLMVRKDGYLVENYGVQPDVEFEFTKEDYINEFKDTLERLLQKLEL